MQVTETLAEGLKRQFTVVLSAKDIDTKVANRLGELAKTARLPGFRPGKVPLSLMRQRYGQSVMGEVLEAAVNDSSNQAMTERGLRPAMAPKVEITSFEEGKDLEYTMAVELLPEITPVDFSTLELERLKVDVTDEDVTKGLDRLAQNYEESEPVDPPRPAENGDTLTIDYAGSIDGVAFDGGTAEKQPLKLGSGRFIPGFEEQLVGVSVGDKRDVKVAFPADYPAKELAGKDAVFAVTVHEVRAPKAATIDDEFATKMGMETLDALKAAVRERIEQDYVQAARQKLKRTLLDKLAETHDFGVPDGMVDAELDVIWNQYTQARDQGQKDPDAEGKTDDELKAEYRKIAERRVRLGLLLSEVGRLNNILVQEEELRRAMINEASRYPGQEREVIEFFRKNAQALDSLKAPLFEEKVVDFIVEMAKVTDRPVTAAELIEAVSADQ